MTNESQTTARLHKTLAEMLHQAELLARITSEEGIALREADIDKLNDTVQRQKETAIALSALDTMFRKLIDHAGHQNNEEIDDFLMRTYNDTQLQTQWLEYVKLIQKCAKQNKANSALVNVGLRHTRQAIEFLHSCVGEYHNPVSYGPRGQSQNQEKYLIAKA